MVQVDFLMKGLSCLRIPSMSGSGWLVYCTNLEGQKRRGSQR